ncbi:MAG: dephospho-CoA kinase [Gemmatimonadota bacterium]|nr:dephospho-CoA kinase [Gemmatimonadota bacterium]
MLTVALTGTVAAGKSTLLEMWARAGVSVVSADDLAREVVAPATPGIHAVREAFGGEVFAADGTLDRARLRERVFGDDEARARLEAILHPLIQARRDDWLAARRREGAPLVVAEIPLLFEVGGEKDFDVVVVVDGPEEERIRRMSTVRRIDESMARGIMAAQMDAAEKRARADIVVENAGPRWALQRTAGEVLASLRRRAGVGLLRMDLHMHTVGSWDCLSDPRRVLERARARGVGRIAITDHNRLHVALAMAREFPDEVIPGEEVKTAEGIDVIGLYLAEEIPKGTPAGETVRLIREQGGVPYLPHPYAGGKGGGGRMAEELASLVDVVEVFNARLHRVEMNERAFDLAQRHGKLVGAGSDAHTVREVSRGTVEVPHHPSTAEALREALVLPRVEGTMSSHLVHLASTWAKVRKKLPGAVGV